MKTKYKELRRKYKETRMKYKVLVAELTAEERKHKEKDAVLFGFFDSTTFSSMISSATSSLEEFSSMISSGSSYEDSDLETVVTNPSNSSDRNARNDSDCGHLINRSATEMGYIRDRGNSSSHSRERSKSDSHRSPSELNKQRARSVHRSRSIRNSQRRSRGVTNGFSVNSKLFGQDHSRRRESLDYATTSRDDSEDFEPTIREKTELSSGIRRKRLLSREKSRSRSKDRESKDKPYESS